MTQLVLGLIVFLGVHTVSIAAPAWRDRMAARLGEWPWKGVYAVISIVGFVLIVRGYAAARMTPSLVYAPPTWLRHVALLVMLPVFPLLFAAYLPGRIKSTAKHPMLLATQLWAAAHLLANGMLADVLLFGGFLVWSVADRISVGRRPPRPIRTAPAKKWNDAIAVAGGLALYGALVAFLHARLFGVAPL